jgi:hypothetical protein
MAELDWRPLTDNERGILELMLSPFGAKGKSKLDSLEDCRARPWGQCVNHCPSLEIQLDLQMDDVASPLPVVAMGTNGADQMPYEIRIFHQREGTYLEYTLHGDAPLLSSPAASDLTIHRSLAPDFAPP